MSLKLKLLYGGLIYMCAKWMQTACPTHFLVNSYRSEQDTMCRSTKEWICSILDIVHMHLEENSIVMQSFYTSIQTCCVRWH